jgi:spore coat protein U-like protein
MRTAPLALALAGVFFVGSAAAGPTPQSGSLSVTATVSGSCIVLGPNALAFNAYDPVDTNFTTALTAQGTISVRCTRGTLAHVQLSQGGAPATGSTCGAPLRQMSGTGTERLAYSLYRDSGRTQTWGCTAGTEQQFTSTASNVATSLDVYGRIPAGQDVAAGNYADTVTVDVTF